ncbi:MAG: hypothetical protein AAFN74_23715, partial [Myxococcota bacterium]
MRLTRQACLDSARSFESIGRAVGGSIGAEFLVYAADNLAPANEEDVGDVEAIDDAVDELIDAALQLDPGSRLAIDRALRTAWRRQKWSRLATALSLAEAVVPSASRGQLLAQRAEVLGDRLGRVEEAAALYRRAATLSAQLAGTALAAADDLVCRQGENNDQEGAPDRSDWRDSTFTWPSVVPGRPVYDPFMAAGLVDEPADDGELDEFRSRLANGFDSQIFAAAIDVGVSLGAVDVARWVLPGMSSARRLAEIDVMIAAADAASDHQTAQRLRAVSFAERPTSPIFFDAAQQAYSEDAPTVHLQLLTRRWRVTEDIAGRNALLVQMIPLAERAQQFEVAAEAHLALLAADEGDVAAHLTELKDLQSQIEDPKLLARGLCAASVRSDMEPSIRRSLWGELARMLDERLADASGATSLRAELAVLDDVERRSVASEPTASA